jgi:hypothetical protein
MRARKEIPVSVRVGVHRVTLGEVFCRFGQVTRGNEFAKLQMPKLSSLISRIYSCLKIRKLNLDRLLIKPITQ